MLVAKVEAFLITSWYLELDQPPMVGIVTCYCFRMERNERETCCHHQINLLRPYM